MIGKLGPWAHAQQGITVAPSNLVRHDPVAVGGPTHAFSTTRASTWHAAMGNDDAPEIGMTKGDTTEVMPPL